MEKTKCTAAIYFLPSSQRHPLKEKIKNKKLTNSAGKLASYMEENETGSIALTLHKNQSKMDQKSLCKISKFQTVIGKHDIKTEGWSAVKSCSALPEDTNLVLGTCAGWLPDTYYSSSSGSEYISWSSQAPSLTCANSHN